VTVRPLPLLCFVVGARPNFMKIAPVYAALADRGGLELVLVHTGQHYDERMSDVFIRELHLPRPDAFLSVGSGTHAEQTAKALVGVEGFLLARRPNLVIVAGDVNSTLAAALAASKLRVPVAHVEAGLRSFDDEMPEEANRRITDHLSRLLFAHSEDGVRNLAREAIDPSRVHLVGNTMIDSLFRSLPEALEQKPWARLGMEPGGYALVTLHRPALVDDAGRLRRTIAALRELAQRQPIVFPVHPRTSAQLAAAGLTEDFQSLAILLCEPLSYLDFTALEAKADFVVTDSGGVQEETSALGVRCFTLRDNTERPVTVELGTNTLLGADPERLVDIPRLLDEPRPAVPIPLWDGRAGERTSEIVAQWLDEAQSAAAAGT
jgi:UDP-N-acetylglucosamine 2-epimerase (non-hydrolysing)